MHEIVLNLTSGLLLWREAADGAWRDNGRPLAVPRQYCSTVPRQERCGCPLRLLLVLGNCGHHETRDGYRDEQEANHVRIAGHFEAEHSQTALVDLKRRHINRGATTETRGEKCPNLVMREHRKGEEHTQCDFQAGPGREQANQAAVGGRKRRKLQIFSP